MNIIELYESLKGSYKSYLESFVAIKDERIKEKVSDSIKNEKLWPKALIQFNPNFKKGIGVQELIAKGLPIHKDLEFFFDKPFYMHQQEAIELGCQDKEFIVTPAQVQENHVPSWLLYSITFYLTKRHARIRL